ncbi:MAG: hypothetical protein EOP04_18225 [Proteobacteria bacterium]|nr:MAG: hypothetical protein EOP04_18225 [Pseudomonadota bacterium]
MKNNIPTYALNNLSANDDLPKAMVLYQPVNQSKEPLEIPHRTNYYGIGLCISGHAKMTANLETYDIVPGCLITMSPHVIKQWHSKSDDFQSFAILFTKDFLVKTGESLTDRLPFFESVARHVFLIEKAKTDFLDQMANDFNTPGALAAVFTLIRDWNRTLAEPRAQSTSAAVLAAQEFIAFLEGDLFEVLGIGRANSTSMLERIRDVRAKRSGQDLSARVDEAWILGQIEARKQARVGKNFAEADRIRKEMLEKGVAIKDSPQGTTWEYV